MYKLVIEKDLGRYYLTVTQNYANIEATGELIWKESTISQTMYLDYIKWDNCNDLNNYQTALRMYIDKVLCNAQPVLNDGQVWEMEIEFDKDK